MKKDSLNSDNLPVLISFSSLSRISRRLRFAYVTALATAALTACVSSFATPETLDGVIRVGLETLGPRSSFVLESSGPVEVRDLSTSRRIAELPGGAFSLTVRNGAALCLTRMLSSGDGLRFSSPEGNPFRLGNRRYPGALEFWKEGSALFVVNEVGLEDYVFGSLLSEGEPKMPSETLKALAVAIRTYAEKSLNKHGIYDVCDTTHCQTYVGYKSDSSEWAKRAQAATASEILVWDGKPIWSLYSTDSGGATANNEDVMSGPPLPYLRAVSLDDGEGKNREADSPRRTWTVKITLKEAERILNRKSETRIGHLTHMRVDQADSYGRAITLLLEGETTPLINRAANAKSRIASLRLNSLSLTRNVGEVVASGRKAAYEKNDANAAVVTKIIRASDFRSLFGSDRVKSTFFAISEEGGYLTLTGRGYGHGVGLCVCGAETLAKAGADYKAILARYFTGVTLVNYLEPSSDDSFITAPP